MEFLNYQSHKQSHCRNWKRTGSFKSEDISTYKLVKSCRVLEMSFDMFKVDNEAFPEEIQHLEDRKNSDQDSLELSRVARWFFLLSKALGWDYRGPSDKAYNKP